MSGTKITLAGFIKDFFKNKHLIFELTKSDLKTNYIGSFFGLSWIVLQPLVLTFIFWVVFVVGYKATPIEGVSFVPWLLCGLLPWNFFSSVVSLNTNIITQNAHLLKKFKFNVSLMQIVKILSGLIVHLFSLIILIIFFQVKSSPVHITIYWIQVLYYLIALTVLLWTIGLILGILQVFFKDVTHILSLILQMGFFLTPIFWNPHIIPENYLFLFKINPLFYIINGYRDSFLFRIGFWEDWITTIYFWFLTLILFLIGYFLFKKLSPKFADEL
ncbi:MAG: ABC transporter permease [Candidatus Kapabacteria bacterium]|nr:ABC transporter permease [Candidatus Kapabacteria bacterium]